MYADWREMLEKEAKNLDCVNVSLLITYMRHGHECDANGLHVYGQKPLTHQIAESVLLRNTPREKPDDSDGYTNPFEQ